MPGPPAMNSAISWEGSIGIMAYRKKDPQDRIGHPHGAFQDIGPVTQGRSRRADIPAIPEASPNWHPQARSWFNSLKLSGQSDLFEASDWATAVCAAQAYDSFLRNHSPGVLAAFVRMSERLGATYIDRKKARIDLADPDAADADEDAADNVVWGWQERLAAREPGD